MTPGQWRKQLEREQEINDKLRDEIHRRIEELVALNKRLVVAENLILQLNKFLGRV